MVDFETKSLRDVRTYSTVRYSTVQCAPFIIHFTHASNISAHSDGFLFIIFSDSAVFLTLLLSGITDELSFRLTSSYVILSFSDAISF